MGKVIIPDNEVWAWNGSILKPNPEHFEDGHTTGATGKKPRHDQFNYMEQRRDLNLQYLLRMAGLPYDPLEVYPVHARASKNGHMYVSLENNNKGNDPISSGIWKHEDDDKFPVGTIILNSSDSRNPATYKGFGVWEAIEAGCSILFVEQGNEAIGTVTGSNEVSVPLLQHNHNITIQSKDLGSRTTNTDTHSHSYSAAHGKTAFAGTYLGAYTSKANFRTSSHSHAHSVALGSHDHQASSSAAGKADARIDVSGKVYNVIGWIRKE